MRVEHFFQHIAAHEIRVRDDRGDRGFARAAALTRLRDVRDELGLAHDSQMLRPILPIARAALDEHRLLDPVPRPGVRPQVIEQICAEVRPMPQMMMWIDDRPLRIDHIFDDLVEPLVTAAFDVCNGWESMRNLSGLPVQNGDVRFSPNRASPARARVAGDTWADAGAHQPALS